MASQLQIAIDRFNDLRALQAQVSTRAGVQAAKELAKIAQQLILIVSRGTNPGVGAAFATNEQLLDLITEMETAITQMQNGGQAIYRGAYKQLGTMTLSGMPPVYAAFGRTDPRRLRAARAEFVSEARRFFKPGMKEWADRFQDASGTLKSGMQRTLVEGQLSGWNQRQIAESFLKIPEFQFSNLPALGTRGERVFTMGGKLSPSDALVRRAHVIARTELNAVKNRFYTTHGEAAGFTLWKNVNMDPVADVCIAANAAGAMTLKEWDAGLGRPPRHPNCDSSFRPVPDDYDPTELDNEQRAQLEREERQRTNSNPRLPG